jgi:hypothetical protein
MDCKIFYFTGSNALQQLNNLLLHFLIVHNKDVLSSTLYGTPSNHIKAHSISDTNRVGSCYIVLFHIWNDLYHLFGIWNLAISYKDDMTKITAHLLLNFNYIKQRRSNLSSSEVCVKWIKHFNCFLNILIIISNTLFKHSFKITAKANNVEDGVLRKRL